MQVCPLCRLVLPDDAQLCPRDGRTPVDFVESVVPPALGTRFAIGEAFAQGDGGTLYRADDRQTGRTGLLKVLHGASRWSVAERSRLKRELVKQASFTHPALAAPIASGEVDGLMWVFRDELPGESLAARIARVGALPFDEAIWIAATIAGGLDEIHRAGLLVRDLGPGHVILGPETTRPAVTVIDLGVATLVPDGGDVYGKPATLAPEHAQGRLVSFRSDLYALGCVLFESLTGRPVFSGTVTEVLEAQRNQPASIPDDLDVPEPVRKLLTQLLVKEPRDRPFSAQQVRRALEPFLPARISGAGTPKSLPPAPHKATLIGVLAPTPGSARKDATEELQSDDLRGVVSPPPFRRGAEPTQPLSTADLGANTPPIPSVPRPGGLAVPRPGGPTVPRPPGAVPSVPPPASVRPPPRPSEFRPGARPGPITPPGGTGAVAPPPAGSSAAVPPSSPTPSAKPLQRSGRTTTLIAGSPASRPVPSAPPPPPPAGSVQPTRPKPPAPPADVEFDMIDIDTSAMESTEALEAAVPDKAPIAKPEAAEPEAAEPEAAKPEAAEPEAAEPEAAKPAEAEAAKAPEAASATQAESEETATTTSADTQPADTQPADTQPAASDPAGDSSAASVDANDVALRPTELPAEPPRGDTTAAAASATGATEGSPSGPSGQSEAARADIAFAATLRAIPFTPPARPDAPEGGDSPSTGHTAGASQTATSAPTTRTGDAAAVTSSRGAPTRAGSGGQSVTASDELPPIPGLGRPQRSWKVLAGVGAGAALLIGGFVLWSRTGTPDPATLGPVAEGTGEIPASSISPTTLGAAPTGATSEEAVGAQAVAAQPTPAPVEVAAVEVPAPADEPEAPTATTTDEPATDALAGAATTGEPATDAPAPTEEPTAVAPVATAPTPSASAGGDATTAARPSSTTTGNAAADRDASRTSAPRAERGSSSVSSPTRTFEQAREDARAAFNAGRFADAARSYEAMTRLRPDDAPSWAGLGAARARTRDQAGTVAAYRRAVSLAPNNLRYHLALGDAFRDSGDRNRARAAYQFVLQRDPNHRDARQRLSAL